MLAIALQAVTAFNLICTGVVTRESGFEQPNARRSPEAPFTIVYRVDLAQARYCTGACASVEALTSVSEHAIVFQDTSYLSGLNSGVVIIMDRRNGRYIGTEDVFDRVRYSGHCEEATFSGFPEP